MPTFTVDAQAATPVHLYYEDYGTGRPVVLIHGWPLSARSWENQVLPLVEAGYRVISYDRRGYGASTQVWDGHDYDTLSADLSALLTHLDLTDVTLVGFSMGGGEVARYIGRYGTDRIAQAVLASAVPPYLYKSDDNPDGGLDDATIEQFETGVKTDRITFLDQFTQMFLTAGDKSDLVSEPTRLYLRDIAAFASPKATLDDIGAFARTDFRDDLAKFDVPTLVIHGDSDGVVPFEVSGKRSAEMISDSTLVVIEGGPHGINASHAEEFNSALIDFLGK